MSGKPFCALVVEEYPTLWSSEIHKGDFLILRQGYAIPWKETEWSTVGPTFSTFLWAVAGRCPPKGAEEDWEKNKDLLFYLRSKLDKEFLGIAMSSASKGRPVAVDKA